MTKPFFIGDAFDPKGVRRVYGYGRTAENAAAQTAKAVLEYVKKRPDTGPMAEWKITIQDAKLMPDGLIVRL